MWAAAPWKMQANKNSFPKQAGATSVPCSLHRTLTSWFGFGFTFIDGWKKERKRHDSFDYKCHGHKDGAVQSNDTFFFFTEYLCALITAGHVLECVWELSVWTVVHFCTCIRLNRLFFFHLGLITPHMRIKIATSRFFSDPMFEAHLSAHAYVQMFFFFFLFFFKVVLACGGCMYTTSERYTYANAHRSHACLYYRTANRPVSSAACPSARAEFGLLYGSAGRHSFKALTLVLQQLQHIGWCSIRTQHFFEAANEFSFKNFF